MIYYKDALKLIDVSNIHFIVAPSSIYLPLFKDSNYSLCVQDIDLLESKHLTGDISILQLKSLDVKYAIIGHFERRKYYQEKEYEILEKIKVSLENRLQVIYCIGETFEERERKVEYQVLEKQIARIFNKLNHEDLNNIKLEKIEQDNTCLKFEWIDISKSNIFKPEFLKHEKLDDLEANVQHIIIKNDKIIQKKS